MLTPLRYHRLIRNWKAAEVARRLKISASYYSRIESGQSGAPPRLRRQIAELFKLPQKALFGAHP